jgi:outer membrane protein assembly factor BamD
MLTDYPDSTLVPQAKQRLRDVQEVLATREADIAAYYATRDNYAAEIARYQTVIDTYPLYSHMDDTLIGLGDAYEAQARYFRTVPNLPEGRRAKLLQYYDGQAAEAYRKVVLEHSAAPHVEDAKDRLAAMNLPIPTPTKEQADASIALENSRSNYTMSARVSLLFMKKPDTVLAPHIGDPPLTDPKPMLAPAVMKKAQAEFQNAIQPDAPAPAAIAPVPAAEAAPVAAAPATPAAPLQFQDVPAADGGTPSTGSSVLSTPTTISPSSGGTGIGVEIIDHPAGATPAAEKANPLQPVKPADNSALPDAEKAAPAPDVPNEAAGQPTTPGATPAANGKNPKPALDKADESSSKEKKKKGLDKLNPF